MLEKILIPLDGSNNAEMVIPFAEELASKTRVEINLVGVSQLMPENIGNLYTNYLNKIKEEMQTHIKTMEPAAEVTVSGDVLKGEPATEILRFAHENGTDLILMASSGGSVRGPWLVGNVAAKVLRAAHTPLFLVRTPANITYWDQRRLIRRILVPLDGSTTGSSAVPFIEVLAGICEAELVLFHVLQPTAMVSASHQPAVEHPVLIADESRKSDVVDYLEGICMRLNRMGLKTSTAVEVGLPAQRIIDYAKDNEIDLVAMSSHGRTGVERWVFGSVTDKVLHAGDTAVLVVQAARV
jgi:nucleotide-binding universal stress UspA family protein